MNTNTRASILNAARELYNTEGIARVSTRMIAGACDISQGNLTYHFPAKHNITRSLFHQLREESDVVLEVLGKRDIPLEHAWNAIRNQFQLMYRYRFFFLDFMTVFREQEELKQDYIKLSQERMKFFEALMDSFARNGLLISPLKRREKESLFTMFYIYIRSWISDAEMMYDGDPDKMVDHYVAILFYSIAPAMTENGKAQLKTIHTASRRTPPPAAPARKKKGRTSR